MKKCLNCGGLNLVNWKNVAVIHGKDMTWEWIRIEVKGKPDMIYDKMECQDCGFVSEWRRKNV